jgi:methyl-accepting chemotaxis protein
LSRKPNGSILLTYEYVKPGGGVTTAAAATGTAASDVLSNARGLDTQSGILRNAVDEFLVKVRAA